MTMCEYNFIKKKGEVNFLFHHFRVGLSIKRDTRTLRVKLRKLGL